MLHCKRCEEKHYVYYGFTIFSFLCQCECHINRSNSTTEIEVGKLQLEQDEVLGGR